MRVYHDKDANLALIRGKKVAMIGFGSQGSAQAKNLRDSGVNVRVALATGSASIEKAKAAGFDVVKTTEAVQWADVVMLLAPDEKQSAIYETDIAPHIRPGASLAFGHGFNVVFGFIAPRKDIDVWEIAPKDTGPMMRSEYERGHGVPCLVAVHQDVSGNAKQLALSYGAAIGAGRAGITETTFREECEVDLFGEQAVFFGGLVPLMRTAYEVMVEAGFPPEMAYFRCVQQTKLVTDAVSRLGVAGMQKMISNTAEYGGYVAAPKIITGDTKDAMKQILTDIKSGAFARQWMHENKTGGKQFQAMREAGVKHPMEKTGQSVRESLAGDNANIALSKTGSR